MKAERGLFAATRAWRAALIVTVALGCEGGGTPPLILDTDTTGPTGPGGPDGSTGNAIPIGGSGGEGGTAPIPPCPPPGPLPEQVPDGWEERRDWNCRCPFYVPTTPEYAPDPIQWLECPEDPYGGCERMAITWTDPDHSWAIGLFNYLDNSDPFNPVLLVRRLTYHEDGDKTFRSHVWDVAAEVDGGVRSAVLRTYANKQTSVNPGCIFDIVPPNEGHYFYDVVGNDVTLEHTDPATVHGFMMGSFDDHAPTVLYKGADGFGWRGGAERVVRKHGDSYVSLTDPTLGDSQLMTTQPTVNVVVHGEEVYYLDGGTSQDLWMWTAETGEVALVDLGGDTTKSLFDLTHDGTNLVWAMGEDYHPSNPSDHYGKRTLWTAPLPGAKGTFKPRLLGKAPYDTLSLEPLTAGCGYVAQDMPGITTWLAFVVRLSDGAAWKLPHTEAYTPEGVVGVTCEHLYMHMTFNPPLDVSGSTIVRIPLSSLEPMSLE